MTSPTAILTHALWRDLSERLTGFLNNITLGELVNNQEILDVSALSAAARNGTGHSGAQFNVDRVLGARIALGFVLMLRSERAPDRLPEQYHPRRTGE
jgi:hypothetical protein